MATIKQLASKNEISVKVWVHRVDAGKSGCSGWTVDVLQHRGESEALPCCGSTALDARMNCFQQHSKMTLSLRKLQCREAAFREASCIRTVSTQPEP
jgi:hypothetical protein